MRKTQVALAALALVASSAALADVAIYGSLDGSVAGGTGTSTNFDGAGNWAGSIMGFKGSEDLGNGMKASFNLQHGLNIGSGGQANGGLGATRTFNRQSNVSLSGDFGSVTVGLQLSPFIAGSLGGYVNNNESFYVNSLAMTSTSAGGTGTANNGGDTGSLTTAGFFIPNAVSYSLNAGAISGSVLTQLSAGTADNQYTAATAGTSIGDIGVNLSYQTRGGTSGYKTYNVNGATTLGAIKVAAGYTSHDPVSGSTVSQYNIGGQYALNDTTNVSLQYASATGSKQLLNLGLQYNLSKATYLYGTIAQGKNAGVLYAGGPAGAATSTTGYAVGVVKAF